MSTFIATESQLRLYALMDEAAETHQPITITGKRENVEHLSKEDWNAINETLYLLSAPGMRESIREGMEAALDECNQDLEWWCGSSILPGWLRRTQRNSPLRVLEIRLRISCRSFQKIRI